VHNRLQRKKQTAEDFTPPKLTNEILDKLQDYSPESFLPTKTFLDPACGNGNLLVEVLKRKIKLGHNPLQALKTLYGCDIMEDNIQECRERLLELTDGKGEEVVKKQIKWVPLSEYPKGSLDYDFLFDEEDTVSEITKDPIPEPKESFSLETGDREVEPKVVNGHIDLLSLF